MDDPAELGRWTRAARQRLGWTADGLANQARDVAAAAGVDLNLKQQTVSLFENGKAKTVPRWYRYVRQALQNAGVAEHPLRGTDIEETVPVELLPTYAGAGGGGTGEGDVEIIRFPRSLIERELRATSADVLAVLIEGDSMEPMFVSGDQLLIDKRRTSITQPGAFCLWDGDGYVIKLLEKVYDSDPPKVRVLSKNAVYQPVERLTEGVRSMGRVVWFGRRV